VSRVDCDNLGERGRGGKKDDDTLRQPLASAEGPALAATKPTPGLPPAVVAIDAVMDTDGSWAARESTSAAFAPRRRTEAGEEAEGGGSGAKRCDPDSEPGFTTKGEEKRATEAVDRTCETFALVDAPTCLVQKDCGVIIKGTNRVSPSVVQTTVRSRTCHRDACASPNVHLTN